MRVPGRVLWLLLVLWSTGAAAGVEPDGEVLARIAGEPVTASDLRAYVETAPMLATQLQVPGGPMRVLEDLIAQRLLVREGQRRGIPRPHDRKDDDSFYAFRVRNTVMEKCPEPTDESVRAYYDAHPEEFSTPLMLRLRRIGLRAEEGEVAAVRQRLGELKAAIAEGEREFAQVADAVSEDSFGRGRGGDIGFVPIEKGNPIAVRLQDAPQGEVIGPLDQGRMLYLYEVTDRREPVRASFESSRDRARKAARQHCRKESLDEVLADLKKRWPVEVLVDDIKPLGAE